MQTVSVWGERCSGTNFLRVLLEQNLSNLSIMDGNKIFWKHGYPGCKTSKPETLHIWIVRDLHSWLTSLYRKPYHFAKPETFIKFLSNPLAHRKDEENTQVLDKKDNCRPTELRYRKFKAHQHFWNKMPNVCHVHLKWLQTKGNDIRFIKMLAKTFCLQTRDVFNPVLSQHLTKPQCERRQDKGHEKWMTKSATILLRPMVISPVETKIKSLITCPRMKRGGKLI